MLVSSITQILLRLFALNWLGTSVIHLLSAILIFRGELADYFDLSPVLINFIVGIALWFAAPKLSALITRGNDGEVNFSRVTEAHLYTAVFLGVGLYFVLGSFASAFNWIHFFAINKSPEILFDPTPEPSYYDVTETVLTVAAGVFLIFNAPKLGARLCRSKNNPQEAVPD